MSNVAWIKKTVTEFVQAKETVKCEHCGAGIASTTKAILFDQASWTEAVRVFTEKHAACPAPATMTVVGWKIARPSGQSFEVIGTRIAAEAIEEMRATARGNSVLSIAEAEQVNDAAGALLDLLAHRDHLYEQVTELQASNTESIIARRTAEAQLAGMNAYLDGKNLDHNPYVEGDDAHALWAKGWNDLRYPRLVRQWFRRDA